MYQHSKAWRAVTLVTTLIGAIALQACERSKRADRVLYVCVDRSDGSEEALRHLHAISDRFNYSLSEYGAQAKSDLESIDANSRVIPKGKPIQADIRNGDGDVVAIASNFGSSGEDLRVSLFYHRNDGEGSPFHKAVVRGLETIEGANLDLSAAETNADPCGEISSIGRKI